MLLVSKFNTNFNIGSGNTMSHQEPHYQAPCDLWVAIVQTHDENWVSESVLSKMAQSWPWDSQIAVKRNCLSSTFNVMF